MLLANSKSEAGSPVRSKSEAGSILLTVLMESSQVSALGN